MKLFVCILTLLISTNACLHCGHPPSQTIRVIQAEGSHGGHISNGHNDVQTIRVIQQDHGQVNTHGHGSEVHTIRVVHHQEHPSAPSPVHTIRVVQQEAPHAHSGSEAQIIRIVQSEDHHSSHGGHGDVKTIRVIQDRGHADFGHHQKHFAPEHIKTIRVVQHENVHEHHPVSPEHLIRVKEEAPHHHQEQIIQVIKEDEGTGVHDRGHEQVIHAHGHYESEGSSGAEQIIKIIAAAAEDNGYHYR